MAGKTELIASIAEKTELGRDDVSQVIDAMKDSLLELLENEDKVTIPGFFTARTVYQDARQGRNPQSGETIQIPAKFVTKFDVAPAIKNYFEAQDNEEAAAE